VTPEVDVGTVIVRRDAVGQTVTTVGVLRIRGGVGTRSTSRRGRTDAVASAARGRGSRGWIASEMEAISATQLHVQRGSLDEELESVSEARERQRQRQRQRDRERD
jgi:hypothetical protein